MTRIVRPLLPLLLVLPAATAAASTTPLHEGWKLASACKVSDSGDVLSQPPFQPTDWLSLSVPSTVFAAQVAAGVYPDPYFGTNMRDVPGETYPIGQNFANRPMPDDSPYKCGWWYRKEFAIPAADAGKTLTLHFGGINYRADIWLNGKKIADQADVAGAYRTYDFDITASAKPGEPNILAVETFAPTEKDLGINWVDWNPAPPDKDMGLWGEVTLSTSGPVSVRSPLAVTHFTDVSLHEADLTVYAELHNAADHSVSGKLAGTVAGVPIEQPITLDPHQDLTAVFDPDKFPQLRVRDPHVWWPYVMGDPHLETLTLRFVEDGRVSDEKSVEFGIREITSELTDKGARRFLVNGKPLLIRGGGWSQDMLLRENPARLRDEFRLFQDMRLNTIRLEGKLDTDDFFSLADRKGILVLLGWCCCDQWEHWRQWTPDTHTIAAESLRSQMLRLRYHPSLLVWLNGSDNPPPADVESAYLQVETETHWPNPVISSASARPTSVTGPSGVKMTGPYDYVPPSYWYVDSRHGGAFGFNTETSPGPAVPNIASLRKFIPADQMWPPGAAWSYHNGGGDFTKLVVFDDAMRKMYGEPASVEDEIRLSQTLSYDSERAMFEAYTRNKYTSTGVIQWMLNNAWPSMIWHLFDYYLDADGGYFGTKKACEPLHIQYSYDDRSIVVVNSTYAPASHLTASARVYDLQMKALFAAEKVLDAAPDSSDCVLAVPDTAYASGSSVLFVDLTLKNAAGAVVSRNFYWVPAQLTTYDWTKTDYTHTPIQQYADLSALRSLPAATVESAARERTTEEGRTVELTLHNTSHALAFQLAGAVRTNSDGLIAPVLWSENYIELMPGESRTLTALLPAGAPPQVTVRLSGWNIAEKTLSLPSAKSEQAEGNTASGQ